MPFIGGTTLMGVVIGLAAIWWLQPSGQGVPLIVVVSLGLGAVVASAIRAIARRV